MNIRLANENDLNNNLLKLYIKGYNLHYENRKDIFTKRNEEDLKNDLVNMLNNPEEMILVANLNNIIVGYVAFVYKKRATKYVWIDEIIVDEKYKKHGYGTKLIREVEKYASINNCKRVELNCWAFNEEALKFYEKLGFTSQKVVLEKEIN